MFRSPGSSACRQKGRPESKVFLPGLEEANVKLVCEGQGHGDVGRGTAMMYAQERSQAQFQQGCVVHLLGSVGKGY